MSTSQATARTLHADVVVIGLGPVGALTTNLLARNGLTVVALDREPDIMQVPRGVGIDGEIMRAMQSLGLAHDLEPFLKVFRGAQYLDADDNVVATRPPANREGEQGWPDRYNVHQPEFEAVLRTAMRGDASVTELVSHEVTEVANTAHGVLVSARDLRDGSPVLVSARYAVGADGGRSVTRRAMGATYEDYGLNQPWIVADFVVSDDADVPPINTHYADPVSPAIYIHVVRDIRRFEFRARPDENLEAAVVPENIWRRVARWISPEDSTLVRAAVYTHRALVVDSWREGNVLLAGDAAHQTPPFLGQGLCTGVRDAMSLAWRLRDVLHRGAPQELLDSYGTERSAHARHFITTATELGSQLTNPTKEAIDSLNSRIGREGRGTTPRLGAGLYDVENGGGYRAPQPRTADGRLVDDIVGYEFGLLIAPEAAAALTDEDRVAIDRARLTPLVADGATAAWLDAQAAVAAVIRPDRYLYGVYRELDGLRDALQGIGAALVTENAAVPS